MTAEVESDVCMFFAGSKGKLRSHAQELKSASGLSIIDKFDSLTNKVNEEMFSDVLDQISQRLKEGAEVFEAFKSFDLIPAVVLILSVSIPDFTSLFSNLTKRLSDASFCTVCLHEQQMSTFKCAMEYVVSCTVDHVREQSQLRGAGSFQRLQSQRKRQARSHGNTNSHSIPEVTRKTFGGLADWYTQIDAILRPKGIVIVVENFETFPQNILNDLITVISAYTTRLPIQFVFCVATSLNVIDRVLSYSALSQLSVHLVHSAAPIKFLSKIFESVFCDLTMRFRLGASVLDLIVNRFLYHNFSLTDFCKSFKFCVLLHMLENPSSKLLTYEKADETFIHAVLNADNQILQRIVDLPEFGRFCQKKRSASKSMVKNLGRYGDQLRDVQSFIADGLLQLDAYHRDYFVTIRLLEWLCSSLKHQPFGESCREIHQNLTQSVDPFEEEDYKNFIRSLTFVQQDSIAVAVKQCIEQLSQLPLEFQCSVQENFLNRFRNFESFLATVNERQAALDKNASVESTKKILREKKCITAVELKESLTLLSKERKEGSLFAVENCKFVEYLDAQFRLYLKPPSAESLGWLYSLAYFNNLHAVEAVLTRRSKSGVELPLLAVQGDQRLSQFKIHSVIGAAYQVYTESGSKMNLSDLFDSFKELITSWRSGNSGTTNPRKRKSNIDDISKLKLEFICALSELELLGFIKSSARQTGYASKLTWSNLE